MVLVHARATLGEDFQRGAVVERLLDVAHDIIDLGLNAGEVLHEAMATEAAERGRPVEEHHREAGALPFAAQEHAAADADDVHPILGRGRAR